MESLIFHLVSDIEQRITRVAIDVPLLWPVKKENSLEYNFEYRVVLKVEKV